MANVEWLLTWIWQAGVVTLMVSCSLGASRSINAATRYLIWWTTLLGVVAMAALSWAWPATAQASSAASAAAGPAWRPLVLPSLPVWLVATATGAWLLAVLTALLRLAFALAALRRAKRECRPLPSGREARLHLWMSVREQGRRARLAVSDRILVPSVLGLGRPLIALPRAVLASLSDEEIDQIVVHEYAHVQRSDDWMKLAQFLVKAAFWFHPAVRWIDRALDLEREVACDDWVVARTGSSKTYAVCLTKLAGSLVWPGEFALAPGAAQRRPEIAARVARLLDRGRNASVRPSITALVVASVCLGGVTLGLSGLQPLAVIASGRQPAVQQSAVTERGNVVLAAPQRAAQLPALPGGLASLPGRGASRRDGARAAAAQPSSIELSSTLPASPASEGDLVPATRLQPPLTATAIEAAVGHDVWFNPPVIDRLRSTARAPWKAAALAGVKTGHSARQAADAAAGFFSRFGSSIARTF